MKRENPFTASEKFLEVDSAKAAAEFKSISIQENEIQVKLALKTSMMQRMILEVSFYQNNRTNPNNRQ
jgi:hypothetical protein